MLYAWSVLACVCVVGVGVVGARSANEVNALCRLQGRVFSGSVDELSPEPEERGGGSQPELPRVYRDGQDPAGGSEPCG